MGKTCCGLLVLHGSSVTDLRRDEPGPMAVIRNLAWRVGPGRFADGRHLNGGNSHVEIAGGTEATFSADVVGDSVELFRFQFGTASRKVLPMVPV